MSEEVRMTAGEHAQRIMDAAAEVGAVPMGTSANPAATNPTASSNQTAANPATTNPAATNPAEAKQDYVAEKIAKFIADLGDGARFLGIDNSDPEKNLLMARELIEKRQITTANGVLSIAALEGVFGDKEKFKQQFGVASLEELIPTKEKAAAINEAIEYGKNENTGKVFKATFANIVAGLMSWLSGLFSDKPNPGLFDHIAMASAHSAATDTARHLQKSGLFTAQEINSIGKEVHKTALVQLGVQGASSEHVAETKTETKQESAQQAPGASSAVVPVAAAATTIGATTTATAAEETNLTDEQKAQFAQIMASTRFKKPEIPKKDNVEHNTQNLGNNNQVVAQKPENVPEAQAKNNDANLKIAATGIISKMLRKNGIELSENQLEKVVNVATDVLKNNQTSLQKDPKELAEKMSDALLKDTETNQILRDGFGQKIRTFLSFASKEIQDGAISSISDSNIRNGLSFGLAGKISGLTENIVDALNVKENRDLLTEAMAKDSSTNLSKFNAEGQQVAYIQPQAGRNYSVVR